MRRHLLLPVVGLVVLVVSVLFYFNQSTNKNNSRDEVSSLIFKTPDFYNNKLINENTLGEFYIVNFFASWCKPCLAEHPLLMEMKKKGITIIGINFRDDEETSIITCSWINSVSCKCDILLQSINYQK